MTSVAQRAEFRDQQRAGHRGQREQHRRQPGQDADLRLRHVQVGVDQRDDRRHRENRQAQPVAGEPQQRKRQNGVAAAVAPADASVGTMPSDRFETVGAHDGRNFSAFDAAMNASRCGALLRAGSYAGGEDRRLLDFVRERSDDVESFDRQQFADLLDRDFDLAIGASLAGIGVVRLDLRRQFLREAKLARQSARRAAR